MFPGIICICIDVSYLLLDWKLFEGGNNVWFIFVLLVSNLLSDFQCSFLEQNLHGNILRKYILKWKHNSVQQIIIEYLLNSVGRLIVGFEHFLHLNSFTVYRWIKVFKHLLGKLLCCVLWGIWRLITPYLTSIFKFDSHNHVWGVWQEFASLILQMRNSQGNFWQIWAYNLSYSLYFQGNDISYTMWRSNAQALEALHNMAINLPFHLYQSLLFKYWVFLSCEQTQNILIILLMFPSSFPLLIYTY